jgi:hypothetical protein
MRVMKTRGKQHESEFIVLKLPRRVSTLLKGHHQVSSGRVDRDISPIRGEMLTPHKVTHI